jgi:hypothetical protein
MNDKARAKIYFLKAIELAPENAVEAHNGLATVLLGIYLVLNLSY